MRTRRVIGIALAVYLAVPVVKGDANDQGPLAFSPVPDHGTPLAAVRPADVVTRRDRDDAPVRKVSPHHYRAPGGVPRDPARAAVVRSRSASGTASWYCGHGSACPRARSGGLSAAAGPLLRQGDWRGRRVVVRSGGRSVRVTLVDWCACPGRVIDLFADAFSRLAPLSRGLVSVRVSW